MRLEISAAPWRLLAMCACLLMAPASYAETPGSAAEAPLNAQQLSRARLLYFQCQACHTLTHEDGHKVGPSLAGIFGRTAATIEDFAGYSLALRDSGLVWDRATMDAWIRSPASLVPGNTMAYLGLPNAADRELLVRYLETASRDAGKSD